MYRLTHCRGEIRVCAYECCSVYKYTKLVLSSTGPNDIILYICPKLNALYIVYIIIEHSILYNIRLFVDDFDDDDDDDVCP